ncbi:hypothetical protein CW713_05535, partial [Methanophagales archaeon]
AQRSIWIFSINSLGLFHEHREDMISLLKKGGSMRVLLLDPESEVFKNRERKEEEIKGQISGRLRAEYMASVAYCKDIINFSEGKGSLRKNLTETNRTANQSTFTVPLEKPPFID